MTGISRVKKILVLSLTWVITNPLSNNSPISSGVRIFALPCRSIFISQKRCGPPSLNHQTDMDRCLRYRSGCPGSPLPPLLRLTARCVRSLQPGCFGGMCLWRDTLKQRFVNHRLIPRSPPLCFSFGPLQHLGMNTYRDGYILLTFRLDQTMYLVGVIFFLSFSTRRTTWGNRRVLLRLLHERGRGRTIAG